MTKRILAVEDDPDILFIVKLLLAEEGYTVYTSVDGNNLLNQVQQVKPDLILMDIMLPDNDGRLLCKSVKNFNNQIPVILMSANVNYASEMKESCANDFLPKPFDINQMLSKVESQLDAS